MALRYEPVHFTIVAIDVAGSGTRDDQLLLRMRADLRQMVTGALAAQGLDPAELEIEDLGDGVRLIVPAGVTPARLLDPFVGHLAAALREHRKIMAEAARLRLRVAVHMGLLHRDPGGWAGEPLVHTARLLDATPVREVLATGRADLAVIVSGDVYDKVVRHGYGLDDAAYRRVAIAVKETRTVAWICAPGHPSPPGLDHPAAPATAGTRLWSPDVAVTFRVGDLLDEDAHLVVGFTDTFDTSVAGDRIISSTALQGQLLARLFGGDQRRLDRELAQALARRAPAGVEKREAKRLGKLVRYPVGTVAVLGPPERHVFATAYSRMGNDLVPRSSVDDLWNSLSSLWDAVYERGQRAPLAMPVVGSGSARIDELSPQSLLKLVLMSFVARSRRLLICRELRIIVHPRDRDAVDIPELRRFLKTL